MRLILLKDAPKVLGISRQAVHQKLQDGVWRRYQLPGFAGKGRTCSGGRFMLDLDEIEASLIKADPLKK